MTINQETLTRLMFKAENSTFSLPTCFYWIHLFCADCVSVGGEEDKEKGKGGTLRPKLPIQSSLSGNVGSQINFSPADPKYDSQNVPWELRTEIEIQPLLPESSKRLSYLQSSFIKRKGKKRKENI